MVRTLEQIEEEVLHLPEESRAKLAERLLRSLRAELDPADEEIARAWVEEAERRDREMSSVADGGVAAEEVFAKIRSSLR